MSERLGPRARELLAPIVPRIFEAYNALQVELDNLRVDLDEAEEATARGRANRRPGDGWLSLGSVSARSTGLDETLIAEGYAHLRDLM